MCQAYQNIKQLYEQLVEKNKSINSETCQKRSQLEKKLFMITQKDYQTSLEVCIQLNIFSKHSFLYFVFCFNYQKS